MVKLSLVANWFYKCFQYILYNTLVYNRYRNYMSIEKFNTIRMTFIGNLNWKLHAKKLKAMFISSL